jgi:hypothetical protein
MSETTYPLCPRCNRLLEPSVIIQGSPVCRRCTLKLTVPLELGLERDRVWEALAPVRATLTMLEDVEVRAKKRRDEAVLATVAQSRLDLAGKYLEQTRGQDRSRFAAFDSRVREALADHEPNPLLAPLRDVDERIAAAVSKGLATLRNW